MSLKNRLAGAGFLCTLANEPHTFERIRLTQFLIVRHGETLWNREHRVQGQHNSPLSPAGERQAQATAVRLSAFECERLVSSDLGRTVQTAQPIASATGLPIETEPRLRERNFGAFECLTPEEIRAHDPIGFARWQSREPCYAMPGGESLEVLQSRVHECLESIAQASSGRVIIVTHGGVLDIIYRLASGLTLDAKRAWPLLNSSVNTVELSGGQWRIVDWGDVGHLPAAEDDFG